MAFNNKIDYKNYYNNFMHNCEKIGQVIVFKAYNMITKLDIIYTKMLKYFNFLFLD